MPRMNKGEFVWRCRNWHFVCNPNVPHRVRFVSSTGEALMRSLHVSLLIGAVALMGCTRESPPGGPGKGTTTTTTTTKDGDTKITQKQTESRDESFKVQVPSG